MALLDRGSGGLSGPNDTEEDSNDTTLDVSTQTLGTTGLGTTTGDDLSDDVGSTDTQPDAFVTTSDPEPEPDITITESDPDPNASSPAGGVGPEHAAEAFTGQEDVDDPIEATQEASDTFTRRQRIARQLGLDVDVTEAVGGFDGDGVLENQREEIAETIQEQTSEVGESVGESVPDTLPTPSGVSPVQLALAAVTVFVVIAGGVLAGN